MLYLINESKVLGSKLMLFKSLCLGALLMGVVTTANADSTNMFAGGSAMWYANVQAQSALFNAQQPINTYYPDSQTTYIEDNPVNEYPTYIEPDNTEVVDVELDEEEPCDCDE